VIGEVVWLTGAVLGLALLAETIQPVFLVVKYLGAAYLLYLAWKLWSTPEGVVAEAPTLRGEGIRLFLGGLAVGSDNPKTSLFYLALLPTLLRLDAIEVADYLALVATQCVVYGGILVGYVILAARAPCLRELARDALRQSADRRRDGWCRRCGCRTVLIGPVDCTEG
jgi:threonine/homoserine/homoserine lactone efflux protein